MKKNLLWLNAIVLLPESVLVLLLCVLCVCFAGHVVEEAKEPIHYILDQQQQVSHNHIHSHSHTHTPHSHSIPVHKQRALAPVHQQHKRLHQNRMIK